MTTTNFDVNATIVSLVSDLVSNSANGVWSGTMTEFRNELLSYVSRKERTFVPGSAASMRVALNKVVNRISRSEKIRTNFTRTTDKSRVRLVVFTAR